MVYEANHLQNNLAAEKIRRGGDQANLSSEERRTNLRLREEQDAAYRAALEADQARESQRQEEEERLEREAAEAERKRKEEEEARREPSVKLQREKLLE
ncbi:unnamed protein product [Brassica rapa]|uniref:Uncharacterized protein n=1 Tax=Brassica campestris TaxID=3711 RepID=A0A8D9MDS4_BRACM|nr:unnamed protein product [Brassica rapa]